MVPAMDRVSKAFRLGLGLALCLTEFGCARLTSRKQAPGPATLGRESDTDDIYAMNRRPEVARPGLVATATGAEPAGAANASRPAQVDEVGVALRPAEAPVDAPPGVVALQAPGPMDPRSTPGRARPAAGVPNASLLLASIEGRTRDRPSGQPAAIVGQARAALDAMSNYEVALHRQERVNGSLLPEEDVVLAIRRAPKAVRLTWPSGPNQGREVLYRADEPGGSMHVKMANPALPRLTLSPESPMVMRNSRHPVTEAGFDSIIEGLEDALKVPSPSGITYAGLQAADGLDRPQDCLVRTSPAGELWRIYFDPNTHLPSLVQATDPEGQILELYHFRDVRPNLPELASAESFDPIARWGQPRGLFGKIARGDSAGQATPPR